MTGRWWIIPIAAVATYLIVAGCVVGTPASPAANRQTSSIDDGGETDPITHPLGKLEGLPYRGIALQVQRIDNMMDYGRSVDKIADVGADTILFVVDSKQENGKSTRIFLDMRQEPTPDKLGQLIQYAHNRKLRVVLMPIVLLEAPIGNEWRGTIHPDVWADWWDSYREMLHHYSAIAEANHVELFVVGSELVSTETQLEEWTRTIHQVRKEYHGQITYSANWDHYTTVSFWDQLDLMGMNSYYDLGKDVSGTKAEKNQATVKQINQRWAKIQKSILDYAHKIDKPVVMLEVGWCSMGNSVTEPWDYTVVTEPLDLDIQRRLYESYFETWYGKPGFGGFMMWAWTPNASGPEERGYTPEGKPAEQVLRDWLKKGPWKVQ